MAKVMCDRRRTRTVFDLGTIAVDISVDLDGPEARGLTSESREGT